MFRRGDEFREFIAWHVAADVIWEVDGSGPPVGFQAVDGDDDGCSVCPNHGRVRFDLHHNVIDPVVDDNPRPRPVLRELPYAPRGDYRREQPHQRPVDQVGTVLLVVAALAAYRFSQLFAGVGADGHQSVADLPGLFGRRCGCLCPRKPECYFEGCGWVPSEE